MRILFKFIAIIFIFLSTSTIINCAVVGSNQREQNNFENLEYIKIAIKSQIPSELEVKKIKIKYELGYGKREMKQLLKKGSITIESNKNYFEENFLESNNLDYSQFLLFIYEVEILYGTNGQVLKGGGGNFNTLKDFLKPKLKKIGLNIGCDINDLKLILSPYFEVYQ